MAKYALFRDGDGPVKPGTVDEATYTVFRTLDGDDARQDISELEGAIKAFFPECSDDAVLVEAMQEAFRRAGLPWPPTPTAIRELMAMAKRRPN